MAGINDNNSSTEANTRMSDGCYVVAESYRPSEAASTTPGEDRRSLYGARRVTASRPNRIRDVNRLLKEAFN